MAVNLGKILFRTLGILSLAGYQAYQIKGLRCRSEEVWYPDLPPELDGYSIVQITDLHGAVFGRANETLAKRIMALEPDILCATGDMVHRASDDGEALTQLMAGLDPQLVKLVISGNHDSDQPISPGPGPPDRSLLYRKLDQFNVVLLDDTVYDVPDRPLRFAGMADHPELYQGRGGTAAAFIPGDWLPMPDPGKFNVALIHRPNYFRSIAAWGYDLMLSGHTHGGIIRIPGIGGLLSPDRVLFPELDKGLFRLGKAILHVSSGLGLGKPIPRMGNPPEIIRLTLRRGPVRPLRIVRP